MQDEIVYFTRLSYNDKEYSIKHADTFQFAVEKRTSTKEILDFDAQIQKLPQFLGRNLEQDVEIFCEGTQRRNFQNTIITEATPLIYACYHGHRVIAQHLARHTCQPCSRDAFGRTALMWACCNITTPEALDCALPLVEKEAGLTDYYGNTALMYMLANNYLRQFDGYLKLFRLLIPIEAGRFNQANNSALMLLTNNDTFFSNVLSLEQIRFRKYILKELCAVEGPLVAITNVTAMTILLHNTEQISPLKHNDYLEIIDCLLPYEGLLLNVKAIDKTMFQRMCTTEEGYRRVQELTTYRPFRFQFELAWGEYSVQQLQDRLHTITISYIETTKQRLSKLSEEYDMSSSVIDLELLAEDEDPLLHITPEYITSALCYSMDESGLSALQNSVLLGWSDADSLLQLSEVSGVSMITADSNMKLSALEPPETMNQDPNISIDTLTPQGGLGKSNVGVSALNSVVQGTFITPAASAMPRALDGPMRLPSDKSPLSYPTLHYADQAEMLLLTTYIVKNMYHVVFYYLTGKNFAQRRAFLYKAHTLPGTTSHVTQLTRNKLLMALELGNVETLLVLLMMYYHDHIRIPFSLLLKRGRLLMEQTDDAQVASKDSIFIDKKMHLAECMDVLEALDLKIDALFEKIRTYLGDRFVTALELLRPSLRIHNHTYTLGQSELLE